jgi:hypothetical protein
MADLNKIESAIRKAGGGFKLFFVPHRGGWKFALTNEKIRNAEYQALAARFASTPAATANTSPGALDADARRRNNMRWRVDHG